MFYNIKNPFVDENKQGTNEIYNITTVNEVNYLLNKINGELTNVIAYSEFDMDEFNKINEYYKNMKN